MGATLLLPLLERRRAPDPETLEELTRVQVRGFPEAPLRDPAVEMERIHLAPIGDEAHLASRHDQRVRRNHRPHFVNRLAQGVPRPGVRHVRPEQVRQVLPPTRPPIGQRQVHQQRPGLARGQRYRRAGHAHGKAAKGPDRQPGPLRTRDFHRRDHRGFRGIRRSAGVRPTPPHTGNRSERTPQLISDHYFGEKLIPPVHDGEHARRLYSSPAGGTMHTMTRYGTDSRLAIFHPPYLELEPIDTAWVPPTLPLPGRCIVWWLVDGRAQDREFQWLHDRPAGLPLIVVLPPASDIGRAMPLLNYVASLAPRAVLPNSRLVSPPRLQHILATPPQRLSVAAFEYLDRRQLLVDRVVRLEVRRILELVPEVRSVSRLASRLYSSRRTLGR